MKSIDNHMTQCIIKAYPKGYIPLAGEAEDKLASFDDVTACRMCGR